MLYLIFNVDDSSSEDIL